MARNQEGIQTTIWASSGDTDITRITDRTEGFDRTYSTPLDAGGKAPAREEFNAILNEIYAFIADVNVHGLLEWDSSISYDHPAHVVGSDNVIYKSVRDNSNVDPTTDTDDSDWTPLTGSGGSGLSTWDSTVNYTHPAFAFGTDSNVYVSVQSSLNQNPVNDSDDSHWQLIAAVPINDSVSTAKIVDSAVTSGKIGSNSITNAKMADNAINTAEIVNNAVTNAKMADNSVNTAEIVNNAVTNAKMADNSVDTDEIVNDAVTNAKIASNAVQAAQISSGAVGESELASNAVTNVKMANNAVDTDELAASAVTTAKNR